MFLLKRQALRYTNNQQLDLELGSQVHRGFLEGHLMLHCMFLDNGYIELPNRRIEQSGDRCMANFTCEKCHDGSDVLSLRDDSAFEVVLKAVRDALATNNPTTTETSVKTSKHCGRFGCLGIRH